MVSGVSFSLIWTKRKRRPQAARNKIEGPATERQAWRSRRRERYLNTAGSTSPDLAPPREGERRGMRSDEEGATERRPLH